VHTALLRMVAMERASSSFDHAARVTLAAAAVMKRAADELVSIEPPYGTTADNADLIAGLRAVEEGLRGLAQAYADDSLSQAKRATLQMEDASARTAAKKAEIHLEKKGYSAAALFGF
jgi:hypothetical protein